jgi:hypothetical protein
MIDRRITKFKLRRGTDDQRKTVVFEEGELVYTTDTNKIYVGTGFTSGGIIVANNITYTLTSNPANPTPNDLFYREDQKRMFIYDADSLAHYVGPEPDETSITFNTSNELTIASAGVTNTHLNYTAVASAGGLGLSADGLYVKYDPTKLFIDGTNRLSIQPGVGSALDPGGGLEARPLGVAVNGDNATIYVDSVSNTVRVSSISAEHISASAVHAANLHPDVVVANGGITYTSSGLSASIDNNTIKINAGQMSVDSNALGLGALAIPFGTIIHTACSVVPTGFLACSGQRVLGSDYPALSAAIYVGDVKNDPTVPANTLIKYGQLWDSETGGVRSFAGSWLSLPDLRGVFVRGWNHTGSGYDASRAFGTIQLDAFKTHSHLTTVMIGDNNVDGVDSSTTRSGDHHNQQRQTGTAGDANETRPVNLPFLACIKAY